VENELSLLWKGFMYSSTVADDFCLAYPTILAGLRWDYFKRIRLFFGLCSSSQNPRASISGGR
jgi:hypothetical protein